MSHKLDPVLDAGLRPEASFMKSRSGEKWGYIDEFNHEFGPSRCVFETDEEGSFLQLTLIHEEAIDENINELLEVMNLMNGAQEQMRFFFNTKTGKVQAKREFIVGGRKADDIKEMVFERYDRMKDIFDDLIWAFKWRLKNAGDRDDMFEALVDRNISRAQRRERDKGRLDFDPAYH